MSVTSSFTPGTVVNSCRTPSMRMLVTAARESTTAGCGAANCEGCTPEAWLEGLDDELRAVFSDDLFGQRGSLRNEHWISSCTGVRYMTPTMGKAWDPERPLPTAPRVSRLTSSSTRRSAVLQRNLDLRTLGELVHNGCGGVHRDLQPTRDRAIARVSRATWNGRSPATSRGHHEMSYARRGSWGCRLLVVHEKVTVRDQLTRLTAGTARPARYTTLSRRDSRIWSRFSPVLPGRLTASW